ncbi:MAG TPA: TIGR02444 family protein [Caulobacteraceae bacterium]|nr:TIGR02444 family protein [Caulobacteraceae bacterium]
MTSAWAFAVAAWGRPGVEAICLDLQNLHEQSAALLLWRCWTLEANRGVGRDTLAKAVEVARAWDEDVLRPLRALRRRMDPAAASQAESSRAAVRRRILDAELEAEHALLDTLETLETFAAEPAGPSRLQALIDLGEAWRPPVPRAALARLTQVLWPAL